MDCGIELGDVMCDSHHRKMFCNGELNICFLMGRAQVQHLTVSKHFLSTEHKPNVGDVMGMVLMYYSTDRGDGVEGCVSSDAEV